MKAQLVTSLAMCGLSAGLTVSALGSQQLPEASADHIRELEQSYAELLAASQQLVSRLIAQLEQLKTENRRQRQAADELSRRQLTLSRQLALRERQLDALSEQRDRARMRGATMSDHQQEKAALEARLAGMQQHLAQVSRQRTAERKVEAGLRWQVARLEREVAELRSRHETAQIWLTDWVLGSTEALEQLFDEAGVDVEDLLQRAEPARLGQGGPLQVVGPHVDDADPGRVLPKDPIRSNIERLAALQRLAHSLPLAPPLDHFTLSSGFGKRRDPFTKDWAFHGGLDFSAVAGSQVLATSPGLVTYADASGPYGNVVEIDHGMGIVTRYGHLKTIAVAVGDKVRFRQALGVIGSTGRSTGLHLHYEVRIDDVAYDPARFLDAGRLLVGVVARSAAADGG